MAHSNEIARGVAIGTRKSRESKRVLVRGWELIIRTRLALPHEIINTSLDYEDKDRTST